MQPAVLAALDACLLRRRRSPTVFELVAVYGLTTRPNGLRAESNTNTTQHAAKCRVSPQGACHAHVRATIAALGRAAGLPN